MRRAPSGVYSTSLRPGPRSVGPNSLDVNGVLLAQSVNEGRWTPTLIGATKRGEHSYARQIGLYNRVGNQVMIRAQLAMAAVDRSMSGNLQVGGLPLRAAGPEGLCAVASLAASGISHTPGYSAFLGLISPGSTVADIVEVGSAVPRASVATTSLGGAAELMLSATYTV